MRPQPEVLVLAPMRSELRPVVRALSAHRDVAGGIDVHRGEVAGTSAVAALIGVGPQAARRSTERLLEVLTVTHVLVSGICGGIGPASAVGDTVVPETVVDLASGRSYRSSPCPGTPSAGILATVDELILDVDRLTSLAEQGIIALDMETAAVAAVCQANAVAWSAFRVVSDRPTDGLLDEGIMSMLRADGSTDPRAALRYVAAHPARVPALVRLGRDAASAATAAARVTVRAASSLKTGSR
ncbi:MAG TPA: hypothetical protein VED63_11765 [Acidimicrobiales bacterium]|nr:hypothetical protein [Acidimicrobiales bacterium]